MIRSISLMAALCAASFVLSAQDGAAISVHGADAERAGDLSRAIGRAGVSSAASIGSFVGEWYRTRGYYRASVDSSGPGEVWISEGKPTYLEALMIEGIGGELRETILASMSQRQGDVFVDVVLQEDMENAVHSLADEGYVNARIERGRVSETEDEDAYRLSIVLRVTQGESAAIDSVHFSGLTVTSPATARTLSRLEPGDPWTRRSGEAARRRLNRARIFSEVSEPRLVLSGQGRVRVWLDVQDGRSNSFDGVVGYLPPPAGAKSGTVTGLVDVQLRNLFGTARQLYARWYQERQERHEIELRYREPSIFGWPVSGEVDLFQRRQDSTYVRLDAGLAVDAEVGLDMFTGLRFSSSSTTPVEGYGMLVVPRSNAVFIGARFSYDTRDRPFPTRSGVLYATSIDAGRKRSEFIGTSSVRGVQKVSFDAEFYYPAFVYQTLALSVRWREITGDGIDESDLYRLGGSTTLRGYRESEFVGSRLIWQTTEYRFFLSPSSYLGAFVDIASIQVAAQTGSIASRSLVRAGYGITSLVDTPIGSVGVSIAMGKGDGIGDAKLHVRLRTEF